MAPAVVIMIGRNRNVQAWRIALVASAPPWRSWLATSTIMIPFFFTRPISRIRPMKP